MRTRPGPDSSQCACARNISGEGMGRCISCHHRVGDGERSSLPPVSAKRETAVGRSGVHLVRLNLFSSDCSL